MKQSDIKPGRAYVHYQNGETYHVERLVKARNDAGEWVPGVLYHDADMHDYVRTLKNFADSFEPADTAPPPAQEGKTMYDLMSEQAEREFKHSHQDVGAALRTALDALRKDAGLDEALEGLNEHLAKTVTPRQAAVFNRIIRLLRQTLRVKTIEDRDRHHEILKRRRK